MFGLLAGYRPINFGESGKNFIGIGKTSKGSEIMLGRTLTLNENLEA
jgi:hypothetical protein